MFTIKLYSSDPNNASPYRQRILTADSFTVLRDPADGAAEITLHNASGDVRYDVRSVDPDKPREPGWPDVYQKAIIENAAGKTTEIIGLK
jgi:hypothetical protein